jgi:carbamoyltransferase
VEDSVVCFLTTGIHYLVIGPYLVSKRAFDYVSFGRLFVSLSSCARLVARTQVLGLEPVTEIVLESKHDYREARVSRSVSDLLTTADGTKRICESLAASTQEGAQHCLEELYRLWVLRLVSLGPRDKPKEPEPQRQLGSASQTITPGTLINPLTRR